MNYFKARVKQSKYRMFGNIGLFAFYEGPLDAESKGELFTAHA
jgi:hypothetical protein